MLHYELKRSVDIEPFHFVWNRRDTAVDEPFVSPYDLPAFDHDATTESSIRPVAAP